MLGQTLIKRCEMCRRLNFSLALAVAIFFLFSAQARAATVGAYQELRLGMTLDEVTAALGRMGYRITQSVERRPGDPAFMEMYAEPVQGSCEKKPLPVSPCSIIRIEVSSVNQRMTFFSVNINLNEPISFDNLRHNIEEDYGRVDDVYYSNFDGVLMISFNRRTIAGRVERLRPGPGMNFILSQISPAQGANPSSILSIFQFLLVVRDADSTNEARRMFEEQQRAPAQGPRLRFKYGIKDTELN